MQAAPFVTPAAVMLTLGGNLPILAGAWRGRDSPVPVSWAGWAALTLVGGWAVLVSGSVATAAFILAESAGCAAIAVCALRTPAGKRDDPARVLGIRLDLACLPGVTAGLLLLLAAGSPVLAVTATVATDLLLFVPTYAHIWAQPWREGALGYAAFSGGAALMLAVTDWSTPAGWAYPVYLAAGDGAACLLILARRRKLSPAPPAPRPVPDGEQPRPA